MNTQWLALLRGINSGGQENVPMSELASVLEANGLDEVKTCLQNGNLVFSSSQNAQELQDSLKKILKEQFQLKPRIVLFQSDRFQEIVADNPFETESQAHPEHVKVLFLRKRPVRPNFQQIERFKESREKWSLTDHAFYLTTSGGFSKLAVRAERLLGVSTITRNWAEVSEILRLFE
jgi:uncharacterized protein (DUF1697 family)